MGAVGGHSPPYASKQPVIKAEISHGYNGNG